MTSSLVTIATDAHHSCVTNCVRDMPTVTKNSAGVDDNSSGKKIREEPKGVTTTPLVRSILHPIKTGIARLLNDFKDIPRKACPNRVHGNECFSERPSVNAVMPFVICETTCI